MIRNTTPSVKTTQNNPLNKFTEDEWHLEAPLLAKEQDADQSDLDRTLNMALGPKHLPNTGMAQAPNRCKHDKTKHHACL